MPYSPCMFPAALVVMVVMLVLTAGCCRGAFTENGTALPGQAGISTTAEPAIRTLATVPDLQQNASYSCGATALQAVLLYWGTDIHEDTLVTMLNTTDESGTPPINIVNVSRSLGYSAEIRNRLTLADLETLVRAGIPVIVGLGEQQKASAGPFAADARIYGHYMIVIGFDEKNVWLEDPSRTGSRAVIPRGEFLARWEESGQDIRNPDAVAFTRMAIIIRRNSPVSYPLSSEEG